MIDRNRRNKKNTGKNKVSGKLLGAGIASVTAGLILFTAAFAEVELGYSTIIPAILITVCGFVLYKAFIRRLKSWVVFLGLYGSMAGLLLLAAESKIFSYKFLEIWPLFVLFCGVCLIAAGFYGKRRLGISYMAPAILMLVLGIFFLLFSTDIIQVTLSAFVVRWLPVGLILVGIVLVVLFFFRAEIARVTTMLQDDADDSDDLRGGDGE
jgi:hypothetical protein